jgi:hypothetical protein
MFANSPVTVWDIVPFAILVALSIRVLCREGKSPFAIGGLVGLFTGLSLSILAALGSEGLTAFEHPQFSLILVKDWAITGLIVGVIVGLLIQIMRASLRLPKRDPAAMPSSDQDGSESDRYTGTAIREQTQRDRL